LDCKPKTCLEALFETVHNVEPQNAPSCSREVLP
jgi:hypothetical protein